VASGPASLQRRPVDDALRGRVHTSIGDHIEPVAELDIEAAIAEWCGSWFLPIQKLASETDIFSDVALG
jgi:hypothetical protein